MKRKPILLLLMVFGLYTFSQNNFIPKCMKAPEKELTAEHAHQKAMPITTATKPMINSELFNISDPVEFIPLGQSGNAYGFSGNPRTYV